MPQPVCPSCSSRLSYSMACDWYRCELCDKTVGGETIWRKRKTRLGRFWLWTVGLHRH